MSSSFGGCLRHNAERIAEHGLAKGTSRSDNLCARGYKLFGAFHIDPLALLFPQKHLAAARAAAERSLAGPVGVDHIRGAADDFARFFVNIAVSSQIAGVVKDGPFAGGIARRQTVLHPR